MYVINVTGFGKNGIIAGLVKLIFFFQVKVSVSSNIAYAKYDRFT